MPDSKPPAEDLNSALARIVAPRRSQPPEQDGVAGAVASYATAVAGPDAAPPVRAYRPRQTALVLCVAAAVLLALDSEGLMTWVQRMELGPTQSAWRAAVAPAHASLEAIKLTAPRRWLITAGERLGRALGTGEDVLLAGGWARAEVPAQTAPAPQELEEFPAPTEPPQAQPPPEEPAAEEEPRPSSERGQEPAGAVTVLLMGDSMIAGSLGAAISNSLARDRRLRVVHAFQTATGLARPDVYDWMKVLPPLIERERPQLIVCSLGANDPTNLSDGERQLDFGEAGWRRVYASRVVEMMRTLAAGGARVLWLGLPPMRSGKFSAHAKYLNTLFAQSAERVPGVEFLELRMLVSDGSGEYVTFVQGPNGRLIRYRLDDGIHYSPAGARAIARWVVDWLYERYRRLPR